MQPYFQIQNFVYQTILHQKFLLSLLQFHAPASRYDALPSRCIINDTLQPCKIKRRKAYDESFNRLYASASCSFTARCISSKLQQTPACAAVHRNESLLPCLFAPRSLLKHISRIPLHELRHFSFQEPESFCIRILIYSHGYVAVFLKMNGHIIVIVKAVP